MNLMALPVSRDSLLLEDCRAIWPLDRLTEVLDCDLLMEVEEGGLIGRLGGLVMGFWAAAVVFCTSLRVILAVVIVA
jgi:hypothetical protein